MQNKDFKLINSKQSLKPNNIDSNPAIKDKTIGIVIPIYNVAPYLRECLDSVINQTYKNLSIVLVNDGSTDNNESLNIAKEYVSKDSRFILIDKENGGLSSARNVGIAWFSNKYKTRLDSTNSHNYELGQNLKSYTITNDNPYNIYRIYATNANQNNNIKDLIKNETQQEISKEIDFNITTKELDLNSLIPTNIDYIIFLDSDDYWKSKCIEKCVKHSEGVDIVWFDFCPFYEYNSNKEWGKTMQEQFNLRKNMHLSGKEWIDYYVKNNLSSFYFAWSGLIDFNFLKNIQLYFLDGVIHEDHNFGCLLFLQSRNIYVLKKKFYQYRIRENSIINSNQNTPISNYTKHIYNAFNDKNAARQYHKASSMFLMFLEFLDFLSNKPSENEEIIKKHFLPLYAEYSKTLVCLDCDPLNIIPNLIKIEPYLKEKLEYKYQLKLTQPKKYKQLKPIFNCIDFLKNSIKKIQTIRKKKAVKTIYSILRDITVWYIFIWILIK